MEDLKTKVKMILKLWLSCFSYLDDEHVDDPDVLDVCVLHELCLERLPGVVLAEGQHVLAVHEGDLAPPRAVQAQHALTSLALVQGQQGLHLN